MNNITKITFYERTLDVLMSYLPDLSGSQLKLLLVIAYMTVKENLHQVSLKIDQLEVITGLSRKTVIKTLKELSDLCLIEINKDSQIHGYSINRNEIQILGNISKIQNEIRLSVISKQKRVDQLHFESLEFPPEAKKIFDLWNTYIYKWLDIYDRKHFKYVKQSLNRSNIGFHIEEIERMIINENLKELRIDDCFLRELFRYKEEVNE